MGKKGIKLAIFDIVGTIVYDNNHMSKLFIEVFYNVGIPIRKEEAQAVMGYEKKKAIKILLGKYSTGKPDKKLVDKIYKIFNKKAIKFYSKNAKPMPFAQSVLQQLKNKGILLAVNSGFDREIIDTILKKLKWKNLIDFSVASNEVQKGRPSPQMINKLRRLSKVKNQKYIAKIGDTPIDLIEGDKAKCGLNIGLESKIYSSELLAIYPHTHIMKSLKYVTKSIVEYEV